MPPLNDLFFVRDDQMIICEEDEEILMKTNMNENIMCSFHKISTEPKIHKRKLFCDIEEESFTNEYFECERLMSNAFTINSAEQSPISRNTEQRARSVQRRLNIAPLQMNYEAINEECATPEKTPEDEESFYLGNSPRRTPGPCPISPCDDETLLSPETSPVINKLTFAGRSFDTLDPSSMDSGYHAGAEMSNKSGFRIPSGVAPRKTPAKTSSIRIFHSLSNGSVGSTDADEYMELFDMEDDDEDTHMPTDLDSLLSGDIKAVRNTPEHARRPVPIARRSLSMTESAIMNRARNSLFGSETTPEKITTTPVRHALTPIRTTNLSQNSNKTPYSSKVCFKRPEPPTIISPVQSKRYKYDTSAIDHQENIAPEQENQVSKVQPARPLFKKSISLNDANIMNALARSHSEPNLIGDFSKPFVLPLMEGRHSDLKSISCDTMAKLLKGEYNHMIASYKVIDCRYPYEFEGGHIRGAQNLYMQDQVMKALMDSSSTNTAQITDAPKRNILVFHCEFSSERGPKLSRFLRNNDRLRNQDAYPALQYPEIYLLHGGYKDFYAVYPELCDPISYRPMLEPSFSEEYKHFRAKTRSWSGDGVKGTATKGTLVKSRSRLVL